MLASATDALVALRRISAFLLAEELAVPYVVDAESKFALNVDADFTWEAARKEPGAGMSKAARHKAAAEAKASEKRLSGKGKKEPVLPTVVSEKASGKEKEQAGETEEKPFELKDVKLKIPKGSFVAIVGRVGSGKVSGLAPQCVYTCVLTGRAELAVAGAHWRDEEDPWRGMFGRSLARCAVCSLEDYLVYILVYCGLRSPVCLDHERDAASEHRLWTTRGRR